MKTISPLSRRRARRLDPLWLWVGLVVCLQMGAWTAWLTLAGRHPVQTVPLATTAPQAPRAAP